MHQSIFRGNRYRKIVKFGINLEKKYIILQKANIFLEMGCMIRLLYEKEE